MPPPPPSQVGGMARPPRDYEPTPFVKPTIMPDDNSLPASGHRLVGAWGGHGRAGRRSGDGQGQSTCTGTHRARKPNEHGQAAGTGI